MGQILSLVLGAVLSVLGLSRRRDPVVPHRPSTASSDALSKRDAPEGGGNSEERVVLNSSRFQELPPLRYFSPSQAALSAAPGVSAPEVFLVLVRHGERVDHVDYSWSKRHAPHEASNPPLSRGGHAQASELAEWWRLKLNSRGVKAGKHTVTCVCTSPLNRCVDTAKPLATALASPLFTHPVLLDACYKKLFKGGALPPFDFDALPPLWPLDTSTAKGKLPPFPEERRHFAQRCVDLVPSIIDDLVLYAASMERAGSIASTQMQIPMQPEATAEFRRSSSKSSAAAASSSSLFGRRATPRALRIVLVTHADVIACILAALVPKDRRSDEGQPSVPYASLTTLRRSGGPQGTWSLDVRGSTAPLKDTKIEVRV